MMRKTLPTTLLSSLVLLGIAACAQSPDRHESGREGTRPVRVEHPNPPPTQGTLHDPREVYLSNVRQVTFEGERSGEGYFSQDQEWICFQSVRGDCPHYQIYVKRSDASHLQRVSPGQGLTTCAYFTPDGSRLIWASTHLDPRSYVPPPESRTARYTWNRHPSFDIFISDLEGGSVKRLTDTPGYDAEGSLSPDGQRIVFTSERDGDLEIYTMAIDGSDVRRVTNAKGYDGGPFFSPDGKQICFRGFRNPKNRRHAQIYVIDADGKNEKKLTDEPAVNWAPYWHPSGKYLVFCKNLVEENTATSRNFELFLLSLDGKRQVRLTWDGGADVLPVFTPDGKQLMWTSTRIGGRSQLYIADFKVPEGWPTS